MRKRKTSIKQGKAFQIALKGGENGNFALKSFDHLMLKVILKTTFSKRPLIKISMRCGYIKPEIKNKARAMTTATNGACIG